MTKKTRTPSQPPRPAPKKPQGNRAQKPGAPGDSFYDSVFSGAANRDRVCAQNLKSLNSEIGILRLRLKELLYQEYQQRKNPDEESKKNNTLLILKTLDLIVRAYAAKTRASKDSQDDDAEGFRTVLKDVALDLGMDVIPWKD